MSRECDNCGNELRDTAKFCGKCGNKNEEIVKNEVCETICRRCGSELKDNAKFCSECGNGIEEKTCNKCGNELSSDEKFCHVCGKASEGKAQKNMEAYTDIQEKAEEQADIIKNKGKNFVSDIKNYKELSKKKKRNIILVLGGVVAIIIATFIFFTSGPSNKVVSQAALMVAEQASKTELELKSYDVIDSFTAKADNPLTGKKIKEKMYLVIVECEVKDSSGEEAETIKYGVTVVSPKKSGGEVTYSPLSHGENCSEMDNKEIEKTLRDATEKMR